jgi:hypothetical protein
MSLQEVFELFLMEVLVRELKMDYYRPLFLYFVAECYSKARPSMKTALILSLVAIVEHLIVERLM